MGSIKHDLEFSLKKWFDVWNPIVFLINFMSSERFTTEDNGVFPKWSRTFIEFSNFSEYKKSYKSLKQELGST